MLRRIRPYGDWPTTNTDCDARVVGWNLASLAHPASLDGIGQGVGERYIPFNITPIWASGFLEFWQCESVPGSNLRDCALLVGQRGYQIGFVGFEGCQ